MPRSLIAIRRVFRVITTIILVSNNMSTKTIKVNTALFAKPRKQKTEKRKNKGRLKSDFMQKVRAIQAQREKELRTAKATVPAPSAEEENLSEFTKSMRFLSQPSKSKIPTAAPASYTEIHPPDPSTKPAPPYSSLKGDVLPTYRQWRAQTRKAPASAPIAAAPAPVAAAPVAAAPVAPIPPCLISPPAASAAPPTAAVRTRPRRKTLRLGKRGRIVGVLVQGMKERTKTKEMRGKMNNIKVTEMKTYLRGKNLIKSGCAAPNDVIREIYSRSRLAGGVENRAGEVLLHNYSHSV